MSRVTYTGRLIFAVMKRPDFDCRVAHVGLWCWDRLFSLHFGFRLSAGVGAGGIPAVPVPADTSVGQ